MACKKIQRQLKTATDDSVDGGCGRRRPAAPLALAAGLAAVLDVHVHRALSGENGAASAAALVRRAPSRSEKARMSRWHLCVSRYSARLLLIGEMTVA